MKMKGYGGVIVMSRTTGSIRMVEVASYAKVEGMKKYMSQDALK